MWMNINFTVMPISRAQSCGWMWQMCQGGQWTGKSCDRLNVYSGNFRPRSFWNCSLKCLSYCSARRLKDYDMHECNHILPGIERWSTILTSSASASLIKILLFFERNPETISTLVLKSFESSFINSLLALPFTGLSLQHTTRSSSSILSWNCLELGLTWCICIHAHEEKRRRLQS